MKHRLGRDVTDATAEQSARILGTAHLFEGGPILRLQRWLGLVVKGKLHFGRTAILVVLVGWVPLLVLTVIQSIVLNTNEVTSFLWQIGAHARYLIAAPMLVVVEFECALRLKTVIQNFVGTGIVPTSELRRFDAAVRSTHSWSNSASVELGAVVVAYAVAVTVIWTTPLDQIPPWHRSGTIVPTYSLAGWWHVLVSMPLLLVLLLSWLFRFAIWVRLLWMVSRLKLRLVASHPDHAAGLRFAGHSIRAFSGVAMAITTISAGYSAHAVLSGGALPTSHLTFNLGLIAALAAIFTAPLCVFVPLMVSARQSAVSAYGSLAAHMGVTFEGRWLSPGRDLTENALEQPDFSSTTDLYQVVANIYEMQIIPIDLKSIEMVGLAMLLPFVPVALLAMPAKDILMGLKALLF